MTVNNAAHAQPEANSRLSWVWGGLQWAAGQAGSVVSSLIGRAGNVASGAINAVASTETVQRATSWARNTYNAIPIQIADLNQPGPSERLAAVVTKVDEAARGKHLIPALDVVGRFAHQLLHNHHWFTENETFESGLGRAAVAAPAIEAFLRYEAWLNRPKIQELIDLNLSNIALNVLQRLNQKLEDDPQFFYKQIAVFSEKMADNLETLSKVYDDRRKGRQSDKTLLEELQHQGPGLHPGLAVDRNASPRERHDRLVTHFARPLIHHVVNILMPNGPDDFDFKFRSDTDALVGSQFEPTPELLDSLKRMVYDAALEYGIPEAIALGLEEFFEPSGELKEHLVTSAVCKSYEVFTSKEPSTNAPRSQEPMMAVPSQRRISRSNGRIYKAAGKALLPTTTSLALSVPGSRGQVDALSNFSTSVLTDTLRNWPIHKLIDASIHAGLKHLHPGKWELHDEKLVFVPTNWDGDRKRDFEFSHLINPSREYLMQRGERRRRRARKAKRCFKTAAFDAVSAGWSHVTDRVQSQWQGLLQKIDRIIDQHLGPEAVKLRQSLGTMVHWACVRLPIAIADATGLTALFNKYIREPINTRYINKVDELADKGLRYIGESANLDFVLKGMDHLIEALSNHPNAQPRRA